MAYRKKYFRVSGNSILESVIALSIISICLYVALLVYASVFSPRTSPRYYMSRNQMDELFFLIQVQEDSLNGVVSDSIIMEEDFLNANLKKITVRNRDTLKAVSGKEFYIYRNE
jgi:hypothetical protein